MHFKVTFLRGWQQSVRQVASPVLSGVTPGWLVDDSIYDRDENVVRSPFGGMSGA